MLPLPSGAQGEMARSTSPLQRYLEDNPNDEFTMLHRSKSARQVRSSNKDTITLERPGIGRGKTERVVFDKVRGLHVCARLRAPARLWQQVADQVARFTFTVLV